MGLDQCITNVYTLSEAGKVCGYEIFGYVQEREIAVACAIRGALIRIISARRARKNEEREYRNAKVGRSPEGED